MSFYGADQMSWLSRLSKSQMLVIGLVVTFAMNQYLIKVSVDLKGKNAIHQAIVTFGVALVMVYGVIIGRVSYFHTTRVSSIAVGRARRRSLFAKLRGIFMFLFKKGAGKDKWFLSWTTALGTLSVALFYKLQGYLTPGLGGYLGAIPWVVPVLWLLHGTLCKRSEAFLMILGMLAVVVTGQLSSGESSLVSQTVSAGVICIVSMLFVYQDNKVRTFTKAQGPLSVEVIRKSVSMVTLLVVLAISIFICEDRFEFTIAEYAALISRGAVGTIVSYFVLQANSRLGMIYTDVVKRFGQLIGLILLIYFTGGENLLFLVPVAVLYLFVLVGLVRKHHLETGL